mmetsp:Transcript_8548/g.18213  ORF Transcript_8548/g.18213 Transcript_8548/m.18213 type:complete len:87 (+) Transcript_8548:1138-1398(+)
MLKAVREYALLLPESLVPAGANDCVKEDRATNATDRGMADAVKAANMVVCSLIFIAHSLGGECWGLVEEFQGTLVLAFSGRFKYIP